MELTIAVDLGRHAVKTAAQRAPSDGRPVTTSTPTLAWVGPEGELRTGVQAQLAARRAPEGLVEGWLDRLFSMRAVAGDPREGTSLRPADLLARVVEEPLRVAVSGLARYAEDVRYAQVLLVVPQGWIEAQIDTAARVLLETVEELCPEAEVEVLDVPAARALLSRVEGPGAAVVLDVGASGTTTHLVDVDGTVVSDRVPGVGGRRLDDRVLAELTDRVGLAPHGGSATTGETDETAEASADETSEVPAETSADETAEVPGSGQARLRAAAASARETLSSQESVDIPVGVGAAAGATGAASTVLHLTREEVEALVADDLRQIATLGRDHAAHAAPGHVLLVGGVAQTPALLRAVREVFGEPAGRDGAGPMGPEVVRDPSPTHAAVLGALAMGESDGAWWPAAPVAAGAAGAGAGSAAPTGARRVPLALAGAVGVLVAGGLGVAALQLTGDDEDPAGTPAPPTVSTVSSPTSDAPTTTTTDAAATTAEPTTTSADSTTTSSTSAEPTSEEEPEPALPEPVQPAPPVPAPPPPAPVEPAPPAPPPTPTPTVPQPTEPTPAPTPVPPPPEPTEPEPTPTAPEPTPTEPVSPSPDPTGPPSTPGPPPSRTGPPSP